MELPHGLVGEITGHPDAEPFDVVTETVDYQVGTPTTGALLRVRGRARIPGDEPVSWTVFVKQLQSARHWPMLHVVPEDRRASLVESIPWRLEIAVYTSDLAAVLPDGLRLAAAYRIEEHEDDRATLWLEDVAESADPWDLTRFASAAYRLGRLAARRQPHLVEPLLPRPRLSEPGAALRFYYDSRVRIGALGAIADDALWQHPLLASADGSLRTDLLALADRMPAVLDALDRLPQTYQHGDASPQNLLVPANAPDEFVAIDWGFDCPQAVGFDLGQLLVGLAHAGQLDVDALGAIHETILAAYVEGVREDGLLVTTDEVRLGYLGSLAARAAFTALPLEMLGAPVSDETERLFAERVRLTRFLVDLVSKAA